MSRFACRFATMMVGLSSLTACAPPTTQDIAADKAGYMRQNFTPTKLTPEVAKVVAAHPSPVGFKRLSFKTEMHEELTNGTKPVNQMMETTYDNLGDGLLQISRQQTSNGIPASNVYQLNYLGVLPLRGQFTSELNQMSDFINEIKHIKTFPDLVHPKLGATYEFEWELGKSTQIVNYTDQSKTCVSGRTGPASMLFAKLQGDAISIECDLKSRGAVVMKERFYYLSQYGVFLFLDWASAHAKVSSRIVEFNAEWPQG